MGLPDLAISWYKGGSYRVGGANGIDGPKSVPVKIL